MKNQITPQHLDVKALAQSEGEISGHDTLSKYERLIKETNGLGSDHPLNWSVRGELRTDQAGAGQVWLHLTVDVSLPLVCQRCLGLADIALAVKQSFRFVESEEVALAQDDDCEEDLLVLSCEFDLGALIEDEVLMALPVSPRHEICPVPVKLAVADADFESESAKKRNPFAVLSQLQGGKPH